MGEVDFSDRLRRQDWIVAPTTLREATALIKEHHYARGAANTGVYFHGLFRRDDPTLRGVAWWLPPTRGAAETVNKSEWRRVLSLSRMAILPETPKNAASFLLARSVRAIWLEARFISLVTYADEAQGHEGLVYRAANWNYVGKTGPYKKWIDPRTQQQISRLSTKSRTKAEMLALGYEERGPYFKHKFVLHKGGAL